MQKWKGIGSYHDTRLINASNPVGYQANYSSAVLSNKEDEDELDSSEVRGHLAAIVEDVNNVAPDSLNLLKADSEFVAPLTVPHMFWRASASAPNVTISYYAYHIRTHPTFS